MKNNFLSGRRAKNLGKWKSLEYKMFFLFSFDNPPCYDYLPPLIRYRIAKNKKRLEKWTKEVRDRKD